MLYTVSADALELFRLMLDTPAHEGVAWQSSGAGRLLRSSAAGAPGELWVRLRLWLGRRRGAAGDAEYDDFAEVIAVDLQAVAAGRARDNSIRLPPLSRRAGGNGDVAVSLLAPERHAVGPIQLMPAHDNLSGVSRRHHDEGVHAGEPLGLTRKKHRTGPEAISGQLASGRVGEVLLGRHGTRTAWLEIRQLQRLGVCGSSSAWLNLRLR